LPDRLGRRSYRAKRERGFAALSRGMIAVGAGDTPAARRHAGEAERLLGRDREPLALLLKAQAAQAAGDRETAEATFRRMAERDETRVLGLRGLFVEARRRNDGEAARLYAAEAARLAPGAAWANEAVLEAQSAEGDWRGALENLGRRASLGVVDRARSGASARCSWRRTPSAAPRRTRTGRFRRRWRPSSSRPTSCRRRPSLPASCPAGAS
jgi:HemY protein